GDISLPTVGTRGGLGPEYSPPWPDTDERRVLDGSSNRYARVDGKRTMRRSVRLSPASLVSYRLGSSERRAVRQVESGQRGLVRRAVQTDARKLSELAFDTQKKRQNYTNLLTGSVHISRRLPPGLT